MSLESKLYIRLKLRRRIDRKILLQEKWGLKYALRNKIDIFLITKKVKIFFLRDKQIYSLLNNEIKSFATKNDLIKPVSEIKIESINKCKLIPWWFENLKSFNKRLQALESWLIVQGSYADSEITNYSDIDLVIFYRPYSKEVLKIKREIEVFLLEIDPLQHHGVFMIDINTFDYYWQMDLPVQVLQKAKVFSNEDHNLEIKGILIENSASLYAVRNILKIFKKFLGKDYNKIGLWEWKFFISEILLLPTLFLGSKGNYVYKRDSFEVVKKEYSDQAWYSIKKASEIRKNWPEAASFKEYKRFRSSVSEKPGKDLLKVIQFSSISIANDPYFLTSLNALIKETVCLIPSD